MAKRYTESQAANKATEILVVEDDTETANMLRIILEEEGYGVQWANNADDARTLLGPRATPPCRCIDLVLMDLSMPGLDPTEMVVALKQSDSNLPPFVVMSARPANMLHDAAISMGAASIVQKPFSIDELLRSMEYALSSPRK